MLRTCLFFAGLQLSLTLATEAQQTLLWKEAHSLSNFLLNSVQEDYIAENKIKKGQGNSSTQPNAISLS